MILFRPNFNRGSADGQWNEGIAQPRERIPPQGPVATHR